MSRRFSLFGACLLCLLLSACGGKSTRPDVVQPDVPEAVRVTPLETPGVFPVSEAEAQRLSRGLAPARQGMRSWKDMRFAVEQSLAYVRAKPSSRVAVNYPALQVTYGEMEKGLERLLRLLPFLDKAPEVLASDFRWVRIGPDFGFTGYYEPEIPASHVRKGRFQYPIYKSPPDLRKKRPYHTRHAIDCKGALKGRGLELAWVEDPVDIFMLQIQGSGRLRFEDGSVRSVLYDGQNGHKYVALGRVMVDRGLLKREEVSMFSIREWLAAHPDQVTDLLDTNPSYVFFKLGQAGDFGFQRQHGPQDHAVGERGHRPERLAQRPADADERHAARRGGRTQCPVQRADVAAGYGRGDQAQPRGSVLRQRRNGDAHGQLSGQPGSGVSAASSIGF